MTQKFSKQKQSQNIQEQVRTLQKQQMDLLKEQNEKDKQFFPNVIKGQKEIEREERESIENPFFKLGKAMFSNNIGK